MVTNSVSLCRISRISLEDNGGELEMKKPKVPVYQEVEENANKNGGDFVALICRDKSQCLSHENEVADLKLEDEFVNEVGPTQNNQITSSLNVEVKPYDVIELGCSKFGLDAKDLDNLDNDTVCVLLS